MESKSTHQHHTTMNTPTSNSQYMLLFRGPDWDRGLSAEAAQRLMDEVMGWFDGLQQRGLVRGGSPLARSGTVLSGKTERRFDGPFAESKEVVGGYLLLAVDDFDEAVALARECPTLAHGIDIEIRTVLEECPCFARVQNQRALVAA
jgi:hypothetical protein